MQSEKLEIFHKSIESRSKVKKRESKCCKISKRDGREKNIFTKRKKSSSPKKLKKNKKKLEKK